MSQPPKPRGLGRGLSALLGDEEVSTAVVPTPPEPPPSGGIAQESPRPTPTRVAPTLPIGKLKPGKMQPRTSFEGIDALVASVKEFGVLQPILVRPLRDSDGMYEIVAGERRWRAAQRAQLHDVPVVIRSIDDMDALQLGLVENLQRSDLTPIDEAHGYRRLADDYNHTQEEIARLMGKSRPHIANTLRLLDLPSPVQEMVRDGLLTAGQGRALLGVQDPVSMARRATDEHLTVRELERMAAEIKRPTASGRKAKTTAGKVATKSADTRALEKRIEEALGLKADLELKGLGEQSVLTLEIRDFDQLDAVVEKLTRR